MTSLRAEQHHFVFQGQIDATSMKDFVIQVPPAGLILTKTLNRLNLSLKLPRPSPAHRAMPPDALHWIGTACAGAAEPEPVAGGDQAPNHGTELDARWRSVAGHADITGGGNYYNPAALHTFQNNQTPPGPRRCLQSGAEN